MFVSGVISPKGSPRKVLELAKKEVFKAVTSILINHEIFKGIQIVDSNIFLKVLEKRVR